MLRVAARLSVQARDTGHVIGAARSDDFVYRRIGGVEPHT
jgi:hypothetical protein